MTKPSRPSKNKVETRFCPKHGMTEFRSHQSVTTLGVLQESFRCWTCHRDSERKRKQGYRDGTTVRHEHVYADPLPKAKAGETACPDCFLIHPVGCCDL